MSLPIYFYIIYRSNKKIINSQNEVMQGYAFNESNYINTIQGIATIKNDNKQEVFNKVNEQIFANFQDKLFNLGKINITLSWQSGLASVCFLIGVLVYTSIQVFNKEIKLGELMAILGIVSSLLPSIANLALIAIPISEAKIAFNRMYEFASIEKERNEGLSISELNTISIKNLSFRFTGRSELFNDLNLTLEKGKFIEIVGESGSGKSTLGLILQRFYNFENGSILVNNQYQLHEVKLDSYRKLIGVTQGLNTLLGEEGVNLSGGQKQIIALARVLYKKPHLLILDEPTSAMDRNTEDYTIKLLKKIQASCAIFFITHKLSTLKNIADYIYVLENKKITFSGSHSELMDTDNFYSSYWKKL